MKLSRALFPLTFLAPLASANFGPFGERIACQAKVSESAVNELKLQLERVELVNWKHKEVKFKGPPTQAVNGLSYYTNPDKTSGIALIVNKDKASGALRIVELQFTLVDLKKKTRHLYHCLPMIDAAPGKHSDPKAEDVSR